MSKKNRNSRQAAPEPGPVPPVSPAPAPAETPPPVAGSLVAVFWGFVIVLLFGTWALEVFTNVSEALLERWLMLPLGLFALLILYLTRKKKDAPRP